MHALFQSHARAVSKGTACFCSLHTAIVDGLRAPRGNTSAFIYLWSPSIRPNQPGLGVGGICSVQQTNTWNGRQVLKPEVWMERAS